MEALPHEPPAQKQSETQRENRFHFKAVDIRSCECRDDNESTSPISVLEGKIHGRKKNVEVRASFSAPSSVSVKGSLERFSPVQQDKVTFSSEYS